MISVVGNAKSLFGKHYGELIDQGSDVIRFNGGRIFDPDSQGTRTTILVCTGGHDARWLRNKKTPEDVIVWDAVKLEGDYVDRLEEVLGAKPSTGLIILERLRTLGYTGVNVFGFDWKETPTWYQHPPQTPKKHNYAKEKEYCLDLFHKTKGIGWKHYK